MMFWEVIRWREKSDLIIIEGDPELKKFGSSSQVYHKVFEEHQLIIIYYDSIVVYSNMCI